MYVEVRQPRDENMESLYPPPKLELTVNVATNWKIFKQHFELYLSAIGADDKSEKMKVSVFLHILDEEAL